MATTIFFAASVQGVAPSAFLASNNSVPSQRTPTSQGCAEGELEVGMTVFANAWLVV